MNVQSACALNTWQNHVFLIPTAVQGGWSASHASRFTPGETAPGTHWLGGWVGPRAGLDDMEKWKFLLPPELKSDPLVVQPIASRYTDCAIPALHRSGMLKMLSL
jgi:hypothetical protein